MKMRAVYVISALVALTIGVVLGENGASTSKPENISAGVASMVVQEDTKKIKATSGSSTAIHVSTNSNLHNNTSHASDSSIAISPQSIPDVTTPAPMTTTNNTTTIVPMTENPPTNATTKPTSPPTTPTTKPTTKTTTPPTTPSTTPSTTPPTTPPTTPSTTPPTTSSTVKPTTVPSTTAIPTTAAPSRHFDGLSFFGGITLGVCLMTIGAILWKLTRTCNEGNYRTL